MLDWFSNLEFLPKVYWLVAIIGSLTFSAVMIMAFTGGDADWKDWLFNIGIAMTSANVHVAKVMRHIELEAKSDVTVEMVRAAATQEGWSDDWTIRVESDLCGLLCMLTKGDADTTVRSAGERNGFVAWAKLYQKHNPKTPARGLMALQDVVRLPTVKDIRQLTKVLEE